MKGPLKPETYVFPFDASMVMLSLNLGAVARWLRRLLPMLILTPLMPYLNRVWEDAWVFGVLKIVWQV